MPNNTKRRFDDEFKRRAVRISYSSERSIKEVAAS
ncbi:MAG: transposase, partial [Clostridiaceae bacterium]|nr:transposase [Clostridiaceae bacterium]